MYAYDDGTCAWQNLQQVFARNKLDRFPVGLAPRPSNCPGRSDGGRGMLDALAAKGFGMQAFEHHRVSDRLSQDGIAPGNPDMAA